MTLVPHRDSRDAQATTGSTLNQTQAENRCNSGSVAQGISYSTGSHVSTHLFRDTTALSSPSSRGHNASNDKDTKATPDNHAQGSDGLLDQETRTQDPTA